MNPGSLSEINTTSITKTPVEIIEAFQRDKLRLCLSDPGIVQSQYGTERESSKDYQGRVIFEFFQNAIDRAGQVVVICLRGNELTIANDGAPLTIYEKTINGKKSDFHSLCTIYDSSKKAGESIGNKGVGFKSVWSVSEAVSIESIDTRDLQWGFELFNPLLGNLFEDQGIADVLEQLADRVPSFYFPKPLSHPVDPMAFQVSEGLSLPVVTKITIQVRNETARADLARQIRELREAQLFFLALLGKKDFMVYTEIDGDQQEISPDPAWHMVKLVQEDGSSAYPQMVSRLTELAEEFKQQYDNLPEHPNVAIAFPPPDYPKKFDPVLYTYLPTTINFGFNVLVHADFVLDNARKTVPPNAYNQQLLSIAISLFTDALLEDLRFGDYPDFYKFLYAGQNPIKLSPGHDHGEMIWDRFQSGQRLKAALRRAYRPGTDYAKEHYTKLFETMRLVTERYYGEHTGSHLGRIKPRQLLFCDPQIRIIPISDSSPTFLPSPDQKRDHLFYQSENAANPLDADYLLGQIPGLKVSAFDPLNDEPLKRNRLVQDFSTLALLEALIRIQGRHQDEATRRAVFAFTFILARRKGESNLANFFSTNPIQEERWLSEVLIPAKGSWHPGLRTYQDPGFNEWIDHGYFREVDLQACSQILTDLMVPHNAAEMSYVLQQMGSWKNVLPLKWHQTDGKRYFFDRPWQHTPQRPAFKHLMENSVVYWQKFPDNLRREMVALFQNQPWLYLQQQDRYAAPATVFLFNLGDNRRLPAIPKEQRDKNLEQLYRAFEIHTIEETTNANKIRSRLQEMKADGGISLTSGHTELYRALTLTLSRLEKDGAGSQDIPVLFKNKKGFAYRDSETVWFVPPEYKKHKHIDSGLNFAYFDDQVNRAFVTAIGIRLFQPKLRIENLAGNPTEDPVLKDHLEKHYLPTLFALAAEALGSRFNREEVLERWQKLVIWRSAHIGLQVRLGQLNQPEQKTQPNSNVLHIANRNASDDKLAVGELWHDLQENPVETNIYFSKFAVPLADMIFRAHALGELFTPYLDRSVLAALQNQPALVADFLTEKGIAAEDLQGERLFIQSRLLSDGEWQQFLNELRAFTAQPLISRHDWSAAHWFTRPGLYFDTLELLFSADEKLQSILFPVDPRPSNRLRLHQQFQRIQALYYLCHREVLAETAFHARIGQGGRELGLFLFELTAYYPWFNLFDQEEAAIGQAIWDIENGFTNLTKVTGDVSPIGGTVATDPPAGNAAGKVDPEKEEEEQKKRRIRGLKVEKGVIRKYLKDRDKTKDRVTLEALRRAMLAAVGAGLKSTELDQYLSKLEKAFLTPEKELNETEWEYFMHVAGSIGDGLGYDILLPDWEAGGMICKVEVKSASGNSKKIYFTDNERRMILKFKYDLSWRIWLNGTWDRIFTEKVIRYIVLHNEQLRALSSNRELYLVADNWIMTFD